MNNYTKQYINGEWVDSTSGEYIDVINPATEEVFGRIAKETRKMWIKQSRRQIPFTSNSEICR